MGADYIPESDQKAATWIKWFARALVNDPVAYRTTSEHAAAIETAALAFHAAGEAVRVAAAGGLKSKTMSSTKRSARKAAEILVRPEAQRIRTDPQIENTLKIKIGLRPTRRRRRHVGPPKDAPWLAIERVKPDAIHVRLRDPRSPYRKALPAGAAFFELYEKVYPLKRTGNSDAPPPAEPRWRYVGCFSRAAIAFCSSAVETGQRVELMARWMTGTCEPGAFSRSVETNALVNFGLQGFGRDFNRLAA